MEYNSKVLALQKGVAILPYMPQILSNNSKNFPNFMYAVYLKALKKIEERIFEIKCIPTEYFEDLLMKNTYSKNFYGDSKSCALLSVNSLVALSATNESWIEIRPCDDFYDTESNKECIDELDGDCAPESKDFDESYLIQCYAVSSIEKGFVLYVTNEKYYNILQYFAMSVTMGPSFKVKLKKRNSGLPPPVANTLVLGVIDPVLEIDVKEVKVIVEKFFQTAKYLKMNEVIEVNLTKIIPGFGLNYSPTDNIYFKVDNVLADSDENETGDAPSDDIGYYISDEYTSISLVKRSQSFLPMMYTKYIPIKKRLGYEISLCPAGLEKYYTKLEELFQIFLDDEKTNFRPIILLSGPRGSGKKTVLSCVTKRFGIKLLDVNCFDFVGLDVSALEGKLSALVQKLKKLSPVTLLMENIELLGRDEQYAESIFASEAFKFMIDKLYADKLLFPIIIVASSNKTADILPAIQRLFLQTVSFETLKKEETLAMLKWLVNEVGMTCFPEVLAKIVDQLHGYLFADLTKLIRLALNFQREDANLSGGHSLLIKEDHWNKGIRIMENLYSDSMGTAKVPCVHWEDVGGLDNVKEEITIALDFPKKYPELSASGLRSSGFLFFGPPGTGKTLMAKAVATEFNYKFLSVKGPELMNMYVGQSEKNVREVFRRAREAAPCVIFFDELDSLAPNRGRSSGVVTDRIVSQLLAEMDGLESNQGIFVIGATNRPDLVDPALLRPGRFDKTFYVGLCESFESKYSVLKALTRRFFLEKNVDLKQIVKKLPTQVTGADIYSICSNAWLQAARKSIHQIDEGKEGKLPVTVNSDDFEHALSNFVPSLTPDIIRSYEKYNLI